MSSKGCPGNPFENLRIWRCRAPLLGLGSPHAPVPRRTRCPSKVAPPVNGAAGWLVGAWALSGRGLGCCRVLSLPSTRLRRLWRGPRPPLVKFLSRTRDLLEAEHGGRHE
eukprot:scaffold21520_cov29-Phaeocystis_antarctica.AAC.3